jgi:hypothetical protein
LKTKMTMFLTMAITCVADPLLIRLASSRSVPLQQFPRTGAFARQARDPVHHLGFDLLADLAFPRQAGDLRASRPVRPQVLGHRRRDLDRALLDPAVPLVDLTSPVDFGLAPSGMVRGERPASGSAKADAMSLPSVGWFSFTGRM